MSTLTAGRPIKLVCGRCLRNLGRLRWPAEPPPYWSEAHADMNIHDWLTRRDEQRDLPLRGASRSPALPRDRRPRNPHAQQARIGLNNSAAHQFRIETTCRCGHLGRLRLHKVAHKIVNGVLTIP